jgi:ankyrin repeat protein
LDQGVPIYNEHPKHRDNSPVFIALKQKSLTVLETMTDRIDIQNLNFFLNTKGQNPIIFAADLQNWEAVDFLSSKGVLIDVEDNDGTTLIMKVLTSERFDLATKLLNRGSDINSFNRDGQTALSYFIHQGNYRVVDFLLKMKADPHVEDFNGHDSCDYAA